MTPTARSIAYLASRGYLVAKVEQRIPIPGGRPVTRDAFGFADLIAVDSTAMEHGTVYVQVTSGSNLAARRTKILASDNARHVCAAGNAILIHGWAKRTRKTQPGAKSPTRVQWELIEEAVSDEDFPTGATTGAMR